MLKADYPPHTQQATVSRCLWPHQRMMLRYTFQRRHPALFVDPRMGKTTVFIRRAQRYKPLDPVRGLRILVIAPNSALGSWTEELLLAGELWYQVLEGTRAERLKQLAHACKWNLAHPDIHLHIPEIADTDIVNWDCVCLDESTCIKNYKSRRARFWVNHFRDCPHRWVMTGTPNPEHLLEFWPQLAFCDGHAFGYRNYWQARKQLCVMVDRDWEPKPSSRTLITKAVAARACVLRRKDVKLEPQKRYVQRRLQLPERLRKTYRKIEREFVLELDGTELNSTIWAGAQYTWLRRLAGGFLNGALVFKEKIADVVHLLDTDYHSEPVVIWAGFLQEIAHLCEAIERSGRSVATITGDDHPAGRRETVAAFNKGCIQTLIIQHQVGETGMRLSTADVAIYYSNPPGTLGRIQTEDRIVHLGKLDRVLTYIDMVTAGTVDEDISTGLKCKRMGSTLTMDRIYLELLRLRNDK